MDDGFLLPVTYQGKEYEFETGFQRYGYIHRIAVNINNVTVLFEPDEERNYRALVTPEQMERSGELNIGLLQAIADILEKIPE